VLVRAHSTSQQLALRARMILQAADDVGVRRARGTDVAEDGAVLARAAAARPAQSVRAGRSGARESHTGAVPPPSPSVIR
jgi:hypothetical protein